MLIKEVKKREAQPAVTKEISVKSVQKEKSPSLVFHKKFGKGVVRRIEGAGENAKVTAFFANYGEKTIVMKFLKVLG